VQSVLLLSLLGKGIGTEVARVRNSQNLPRQSLNFNFVIIHLQSRASRALNRIATLAPRSQDLSAIVQDLDALLSQRTGATGSARIGDGTKPPLAVPVDTALQRLIASLSGVEDLGEIPISSMPWY
jgi:hypothetical protein